MLKIFLLASICVALLGCSQEAQEKPMTWTDVETGEKEPVPAELRDRLKQIGQAQSEGLDGAKVTVRSAYDYKGYSYLEPVEIAKLIAVDVEFSGYDADFDLDDVDIIDGKTGVNYGSDPHMALLTPEGKIEPDESKWPQAPGPLRILLIYAVPKECSSVRLGYWGKDLTSNATVHSEGGPSLKKPKEDEKAGK